MYVKGVLMENIVQYYKSAFDSEWFWLLVALIVADLLLGNVMAWTQKIYTSKKGISGFIKHFGILISVTLVLPLIQAISKNEVIAISVIMYLCYLYLISILETLGKMGYPIPSFLKDRLTQVVESKLNIEITDVSDSEIKADVKTELNTRKDDVK